MDSEWIQDELLVSWLEGSEGVLIFIVLEDTVIAQ